MASSFSIDTLELEAFVETLERAAGQVSLEARSAAFKTARKIVRTAKRRVPVRTGRLRSSIAVSPDTEAGRAGVSIAGVVASAPYAGFVEFGTSRMRPRPYLRPAFEKHRPEFIEELSDIGIDLLGGRGRGGVGRTKKTIGGQKERFSIEQQLVAGSFRRGG